MSSKKPIKNDCQCSGGTYSAEATITMPPSISTLSQNHRRLIGILRYRGQESEAVMAARLVKVESLKITLQSVLDDLDTSIEVWASTDADIGQEAVNCENDTFQYDAQRIARRHVQFVEGMLKTALSKIYASKESAREHPGWESGQPYERMYAE